MTTERLMQQQATERAERNAANVARYERAAGLLTAQWPVPPTAAEIREYQQHTNQGSKA